MNYNIIVNKRIYEKYKDEFINLNVRLFTNEYFYDIDSFRNDIALTGIKNYLSFANNIKIYAATSFIDFINILLILLFLKENNYMKSVTINYYLLNENKIVSSSLSFADYLNVNLLVEQIKNNKKATVNDLKLIGINNYINFYNMLVDKNKFLLSLDEIIEEKDFDIDEIATYLCDKYDNFGLSKEFYVEYLKKVRDENV